MSSIDKMQAFGSVEDEGYEVEVGASEEHDEEKEEVLTESNEVKWTPEQTSAINTVTSKYGNGCMDYLDKSMSPERILLYGEAYGIGREYVETLTKFDLNDAQVDAAVYAFKREFNMVEQLAAGETPEHVKLISDAVNKDGFNIMDFFDESGSFLNYAKLRVFVEG